MSTNMTEVKEIQNDSDMMIGEGYNLGSNAVSSYGR